MSLTLKQIEQHFHIMKNHVGDGYCLYDLDSKSCPYYNHRYLCTIVRVGSKYSVESGSPVGDIDSLKQQVEAHLKTLKYYSGHYQPCFMQNGSFELMVTNDFMRSLGFELGGYNILGNTYRKKYENVYGEDYILTISHIGLDYSEYRDAKEKGEDTDVVFVLVKQRVNGVAVAWQRVKCKHEIEDILSTLKTMLLSNTVYNVARSVKELDLILQTESEIKSNMQVTLMKEDNNSPMGLSLDPTHRKALKEKLQKIIDQL